MGKKDTDDKVIFDGENYDEWYDSIVDHFMTKNIFRAIQKVKPRGNPKGKESEMVSEKDLADKIEKWELMDEAARGKIGERVHPRYKLKLRDCQTAKEKMDRVLEIYQSNKMTATINTREKFKNASCHEDKGVEDFIALIENCMEKLKGCDSPIGTIEATLKVTSALTWGEWKSFTSSLRAQQDLMNNWNVFSSKIVQEARGNLASQNQEKETKSAMNASKQRFKGRCSNCNKKGHKKADCWLPGGDKEGQGPKQQASKQAGTATRNERFLLMANRSGNDGKQKVPILDSGASDHMFGNKDAFESYETIPSQPINLADKSIIYAVGKGNVPLTCDGKEIVLQDVYHVPKLTGNDSSHIR